MNQKITFQINEAYYEAIYQIWLQQRTTKRKWQPLVIIQLSPISLYLFYIFYKIEAESDRFILPIIFCVLPSMNYTIISFPKGNG